MKKINLFILLIFLSVYLFGNTITVGYPDSKFTSIQKAVESAEPGDTIQLAKNVYKFKEIIIDKPVNFDGNGSELNGNINYEFYDEESEKNTSIKEFKAVLMNFVLTGANSKITIESASCTLKDIKFNTKKGIEFLGESVKKLTVENCEFINTYKKNKSTMAITFLESGVLEVKNSYFDGFDTGIVLMVDEEVKTMIENNTFRNINSGVIVVGMEDDREIAIDINKNRFEKNETSIYINGCGKINISDNVFVESKNYDIYLDNEDDEDEIVLIKGTGNQAGKKPKINHKNQFAKNFFSQK